MGQWTSIHTHAIGDATRADGERQKKERARRPPLSFSRRSWPPRTSSTRRHTIRRSTCDFLSFGYLRCFFKVGGERRAVFSNRGSSRVMHGHRPTPFAPSSSTVGRNSSSRSIAICIAFNFRFGCSPSVSIAFPSRRRCSAARFLFASATAGAIFCCSIIHPKKICRPEAGSYSPSTVRVRGPKNTSASVQNNLCEPVVSYTT